MTTDRATRIQQRLQAELQPTHIEIVDESARHAGHAGARESGGGHFHLQIVAECFAGKNRVQRHRMVYDAVKDDFGPTIHALSIQAKTPEEV